MPTKSETSPSTSSSKPSLASIAKSIGEINASFTPEEEDLLTPFDALACDLNRRELAAKDTCAAAWLCMSIDARAEARKNALVTLRLATGKLNMTEADAIKFAKDGIPAETMLAWVGGELALKESREGGNPRGFFYPEMRPSV